MDLVPQSRIGKVVLSAWLLLCLSLLAFAYVQREEKDMAAIFTTSLVAMTAPLRKVCINRPTTCLAST
jgi:hypothetical protein